MERFDAYVERCLYSVDGFYQTGGVAGRRGDFLTSPEVGPLFAEVVALGVDRWWTEMGRPANMVVYDVGTGPGTLMRGLNAQADGRWKAVGVDRVGPAATATLPEDLTGSIIVANELLDNLPFRVVERHADRWLEVMIDLSGPEPKEYLVETEPLPFDVPVGQRVPVHNHAVAWVRDVLRRGVSRLVVIDYGARKTVELSQRGGWLRTYRNHQRGHDPLVEPGRWDITTDIGFDQLPKPDVLIPQGELLESWGINELVAEGKRRWLASRARPKVADFKMRSRINEGAALCDRSGLGGWLAACWTQDSTLIS